MSDYSLSAMPKQLELDLWQMLAVAQAEPANASMVILCSHLEGLDLIDGARAIPKGHYVNGELGEIFRFRAEITLSEIAAVYLPEQEPIVDDELWEHLCQRTFVLRDEHLYLEPEHDYPESRQSVIKLGAEADELISDELRKVEVARQILGNAHSEDVELWAAKVRKVMAKVGEMSLLDLQKRSKLSLVDLWLGLLLGDTGCSIASLAPEAIERSGAGGDEDFYWGGGILVLGIDR
jgi:hypothetical protein